MDPSSPFEIGKALERGDKLTLRPLCIFSSLKAPLGAIAAPLLDRCIVRALIRVAQNPTINAIYLDSKSEILPK